MIGLLLHTLADADDESYALCCEALSSFDARDRLKRLTVPQLAISGRDDPVATTSAVAEMAGAVADGRSSDVVDAGHLAPVEQPEAVASLLTAFFRTTDRSETTDDGHRQ